MTDLEKAREAFLCMIADAVRWEVDPDERGVEFHLTTREDQLVDLMEALGIERGHYETPEDALNRALAAPALQPEVK